MIYLDSTGHLVTSAHIDELHSFARAIGLKREWFQAHPRHPHYDLTTARIRRRAIQAGAVLVSSKEIVRICRQGGQGNAQHG